MTARKVKDEDAIDTADVAAADTAADAPAQTGDVGDGDLGQAEVAAKLAAEQEQGFAGVAVDPTPNENYSMETSPDAPTPETDDDAAAAARAARH